MRYLLNRQLQGNLVPQKGSEIGLVRYNLVVMNLKLLLILNQIQRKFQYHFLKLYIFTILATPIIFEHVLLYGPRVSDYTK